MNRPIVLAIAIGVVLTAIIGGVLYRVHVQIDGPIALAPLQPEDPEQRRREIAEAFAKDDPPANEQEMQALQRFFDELGAAFRKKDSGAIASRFDVERMYVEIARSIPSRLNWTNLCPYLRARTS